MINSIRVVYILTFVVNTNIIAINKAVMMAAVLLFEVPTGFFSDKYGDKKTFLLSKCFSILSLLMMILCRNQWGFILSFIILGISGAFESGAKNSYYRRLCKSYQLDYKNIKINIAQKSNIIKLIFSVLGSVLFSYNMYLPFVVTLIMYSISFIALFILPSDSIKRYHENENLWSTTKNVWFDIIGDSRLFMELMVYTIVTGLLIVCFDYYQLLFKSYHIPVYLFGSIYASFKFLAYYGIRIYKKDFNKNWSILFIALSFIFIWYQNIYLFGLSIIIQQIFYSFENMKFDILLLEKLEKENKGAHFESVISLIYALFRIGILALVAVILKYVDLHVYFLWSALILILVFGIRSVGKNGLGKRDEY